LGHRLFANLSFMPLINTARLRIREFTSGDRESFVQFMLDSESTAFLAFTQEQKSREGAKKLIEATIESYDSEHPMLAFAVEERASGQFVGFCGLNPQDAKTVEVIYAVMPIARHQGYATEMLIAITDYGLNELGYGRAIALILPQNEASKQVAQRAKLKDCGFVNNDKFMEPVHQFVLKKHYAPHQERA